jgi:hypothetical protein
MSDRVAVSRMPCYLRGWQRRYEAKPVQALEAKVNPTLVTVLPSCRQKFLTIVTGGRGRANGKHRGDSKADMQMHNVLARFSPTLVV